MSDRLDHYIYETNFVGPALVVFGVPAHPPLVWNDSHNGWDFPIPADGQILLTSTPASEVSVYASHQMRQPDGSLTELPYQTPTNDRPIAAVGPRSSPMPIDLDSDTFVEFWTYSPMTVCGPSCPADVVPAPMATRKAVRAAAKDLILSKIRSRDIPRSQLDVRENQ